MKVPHAVVEMGRSPSDWRLLWAIAFGFMDLHGFLRMFGAFHRFLHHKSNTFGEVPASCPATRQAEILSGHGTDFRKPMYGKSKVGAGQELNKNGRVITHPMILRLNI